MAKTAPVLNKLPKAHYTEIGRIMFMWARLEWQLRQISYLLVGVGPKVGRVSIREPRAIDHVTMLQDLIELRRIQIDFDFKKYKKFLEPLGNHRDCLAHGIWLKRKPYKAPVLQLTKGSWQPDQNNPQKKTKRRILPQGSLIQLDELKEFAPLIEQAILAAIEIHRKVETELESLRQKSDAQQTKSPRPHGRN